MKKIFLALLLAVGFTTAHAQLTANVGLTSDYRFRGVSQSNNGAAVQGGVDYAHSSGLYLGNWNSSVSTALYPNSSGAQSDLYAGWKKDVYKGLTVDVGSYNYFYLGKDNSTDSRFNIVCRSRIRSFVCQIQSITQQLFWHQQQRWYHIHAS